MKPRKELKEAYKHRKPVMGIFQIRNIVSGKILIDGSTDMLSKWNRHKTELNFGSHKSMALQDDWDRDKQENFIFEILSELKLEEDQNPNPKKN